MRGAILLLPSTPSWRGTQLKKAQGQLYLHILLRCIGYKQSNWGIIVENEL
jgi:hypothetical protein